MESRSEFGERRKHPRFPVALDAQFRTRRSTGTLKVCNLSQGGLDLHELIRPSVAFRNMLDRNRRYERSVPFALAFSSLVYQFAKGYCRLEVKGQDNIPYGSKFLWTHNHSGWIALDAVLIGHLVAIYNQVETFDWSYERMGMLGVLNKIAQKNKPGDWGVNFWNNTLTRVPIASTLIKAMHGLPVSALKRPESLKDYRIFATPAEGEDGNCKSSITDLYKLQLFRRGAARLAMDCSLDYILPTVIVGPEETLPSLGKCRLFEGLIGTLLPIPAPVPPIPVRWTVRFLPPIDLARYRRRYKSADAPERMELCREIMAQVRDRIKTGLAEETHNRKMFVPWFLDSLVH